jgi:hypothetical protein
VAVNVDIATHEQKYKLLVKDIKTNMDTLLTDLRKTKTTNQNFKVQIENI